MKVIKLNRRWKQFKEQGHVVAFKFNGWEKKVKVVQEKLKEITQSSGWSETGEWYSYYGARPGRDSIRPYFITMRSEQVATMVLLSMKDTNEGT